MNLENSPLTLLSHCGHDEKKSKEKVSREHQIPPASSQLLLISVVKKIPLSPLEKENGLGVYCKGNENIARSKRMLAGSRNWVKEEERETLQERGFVCGQEAGQLIQRERGHLGSWDRYGLRDRSSRKRFRKICLSDQIPRAECRIDLIPICLRTVSSDGILGILKEKDRVRCLTKGHLTLTEQGKGHGKKCCQ